MMNEDKARELLPIHADGELDERQAAEMEEALAASAALRDELERWRALRHCACRVVNSVSAPTSLKNSVLAGIAAQPKVVHFHPARWFSGITAAAAALALMFFLFQPKAASAVPTISADRFAEIYTACAKGKSHNTLGLDTKNLDHAREQLAQIMGGPVLLPDLSAGGFEFAGACRCFRAQNLAAVHVFYKRESPTPATVSLFTVSCKVCVMNCRCERCVCATGRCRDYQVACADKATVIKWDDGPCSYAICSDLHVDELRALAEGIEHVAASR